MEFMPLFMFLTICIVLMMGFPVAFTLGGIALAFAGVGLLTGTFDGAFLEAFPNRLFGLISNQTLMAVPFFVFMGVMLQKSKVAEDLLESMSLLFGSWPGGVGIAVTVVGMLMAASTGIVGATVVTMGLISLPAMIKQGYDPKLATGAICATGTLGQIIPPSIALVILGDVLSSAYQQAQLSMGIFSPKTVSVGDLFVGAIIPGLILVMLYGFYIYLTALFKPETAPTVSRKEMIDNNDHDHLWKIILQGLVPPLILIISVLGSIVGGIATPTEAASVGAFGATVLAAFRKKLSLDCLRDVCQQTTQVTCMVFMIFIGAAIFSLVFRGFGGEELIQSAFENIPGGALGAMLVVMIVIFLLGFILDFIEITFVVVPIVAPILLAMGLDPVWLGIMIAINLQTSFLTPPFGFALFYLRGVAPPEVKTSDMYKGVIPFIIIQLLLLIGLAFFPELATWLPEQVYGN